MEALDVILLDKTLNIVTRDEPVNQAGKVYSQHRSIKHVKNSPHHLRQYFAMAVSRVLIMLTSKTQNKCRY